MFQADTIRNLTASVIAIVVVAGGMLQIYILLKEGIISGDAGLAILGPLIGAAVTYVFNKDANTSGARAAERAFTQGQASQTNPPSQPTADPPS